MSNNERGFVLYSCLLNNKGTQLLERRCPNSHSYFFFDFRSPITFRSYFKPNFFVHRVF